MKITEMHEKKLHSNTLEQCVGYDTGSYYGVLRS